MPLPSGRPHMSNETPGPALATLAMCSAGVSGLVAGSVIIYQLKHRRLGQGSKLDLEWNILLIFASTACIAQAAVTAAQVEYGLGYPVTMLTSHDVIQFLKLEYANSLLYIGSLLLLKGVQLLLQLATTFQKPNYWTPAIIMAGMLAFFLTAAFECNRPFWKLRDNKCINQTAFWIVLGVFDIITDIYSVSVVMYVSSGLKINTPNKVKLLIILASKFLPAACAVARLPFIHAAYTSSNYTIALYKLGMATQLQLHLSVVSLSLGKIFHFLNFLDVGYLSSAIEPTHGKGTANRSRLSRYGYNSKLSNNSSHNHKKKRSISDHDSSKNLVPSNYGQVTVEVEGAMPMGRIKSGPGARQEVQRPVPERQPTGTEIVVTTRTTQYEVRSESAAKDRMGEHDIAD